MTWWCAATRVPWTWTPRAYPGVWLFVATLAVAGVTTSRRTGVRLSRRQRAAAWAGLGVFWVATDWPLGALGSGYLASAHMLQYFLYTFVAAPLLVLAVPEELARRALARPWAARTYQRIVRPIPAAAIANVVLVVTHAPLTIDSLRLSQLGSFGLDLVWLVGGIALWLPICGPIPEARPSYPIRCVYLFLAAGLVPMVPGGFLTFADFPLYSLYELAPRIGDVDPISDQQLAGALMKIGSLPVIWPVIGTMFLRWARIEMRRTSAPARAR